MVLAGGGMALLAGCVGGNGIGSSGAAQIDARVAATRDYLFNRYPGTRELAARSAGVLYMPLVTEALRIQDVTVDYYSATKASFGLQIGAQQYAHALFFTTDAALADFRRSNGWAAGADIRYATPEMGQSLGKETTELDPVVALVFGQQGLIAGASVAGVKYTRIIP
jgi:hypothetical protein